MKTKLVVKPCGPFLFEGRRDGYNQAVVPVKIGDRRLTATLMTTRSFDDNKLEVAQRIHLRFSDDQLLTRDFDVVRLQLDYVEAKHKARLEAGLL
jgi:hypothetical protein